MGGSTTSGLATVNISSSGVPEKTAWAKPASDKYDGGYPEAATAAPNSSDANEVRIVLSTAEKRS